MLALTWVNDVGSTVRETLTLTGCPFGGNLVLAWDQHRHLDQALEAGLRIVSLAWGDPRWLRSACARGRCAGASGTRFLLAEETPVHPVYKQQIIAAAETDAHWYRDLYDIEWPDAPHRALRNSTASTWAAAGCPQSGVRPGEGETIARRASGKPIIRYSAAMPLVGTSGDIAALSLWAGQSVALATARQPAAEIVTELVAQVQAGQSSPEPL